MYSTSVDAALPRLTYETLVGMILLVVGVATTVTVSVVFLGWAPIILGVLLTLVGLVLLLLRARRRIAITGTGAEPLEPGTRSRRFPPRPPYDFPPSPSGYVSVARYPLPPPVSPPSSYPSVSESGPSPPMGALADRYCPACGAEGTWDAPACWRCGNRLSPPP